MEEIVEIETVKIDASLSKENKITKFVCDIKNPYKFKAGDIIVNVTFDKNGPSLQDRMLQYLRVIMT